MNLTKKMLVALSLLSIAAGSLACQRQLDSHPRATIEGGNTPKFIVSGRGPLDSISVSGPDMKRQAPEGAMPYFEEYWMIMPKSEMDVQRLEELGAINYGQVPAGFVQWVPKRGEPAPLPENSLLYFRLQTKTGGAVTIRFSIREGKIVIADD